jgi:hypothetical protein
VYSIYGHAKNSAANSQAGTLEWDGTDLAIAPAGVTAATGSICGWSNETARWVLISSTGSSSADPTTLTTAIAMRFGSWAP